MGEEPGRRFLKQSAAKLEPVIVVFDKSRHIPGFWSFWFQKYGPNQIFSKKQNQTKDILAILAK